MQKIQENAKKGNEEIDQLDSEAKESLWIKKKQEKEQRILLRKLISDMDLSPEFQTTFFQGLLLPDKLTEQFL